MATQNETVAKLASLIKGIKFAMLTTVTSEGHLHSRPMATQEADFDGTLWFLTANDSPKIADLSSDSRVNVAYSDPDGHRYVSVFGRAQLVEDHAKINELWNPIYKAWFPEGKEDPRLCLLRVDVEGAEYWSTPEGRMVQLIGFVKAVVTGEQYHPGENKTVSLKPKSVA